MRLSPNKVLALFFLIVIGIGTFFLWLPFSWRTKAERTLINSLFTATSAVCVTGLTVINIGADFTLFGQIVVLLLIQIGGLGYMTLATITAAILGKLPLKERLIMKETVDQFSFEGLIGFLKNVIKLTFVIEFIGATILTICFWQKYPPLQAIYCGIFHSISAFCNAGFSLFKDNFESFNRNFVTIITVALLVICGGIGYLVLVDIIEIIRLKRNKQLHMHSKVVLTTTLILILSGTFFVLIFERNNPQTLLNMPLQYKLLNSFFQAVTPRTAGFSTIKTGELFPPTLLFIMFLMFIGASPGGTGGGIKTSTFAVVIKSLYDTFCGKINTDMFSRKISSEQVNRAYTLTIAALLFLGIMLMSVLLCEKQHLLAIAFEVFSAFGTVGLSMGITSTFNSLSKLLVILTMYTGRVGLLTLGIAIFQKELLAYQYPEEKIMIG